MPLELAAAAFVRGAARSTAAEPWKAAVRAPTYLALTSPGSHRRPFLSTPSTSPPDAAYRRGNLTISTGIQEHASGRAGWEYSTSPVRNFLPTNDPRSWRFLSVAPCSVKGWSGRHGGGAYSNRCATSPRAGATPSDQFRRSFSGVPYLRKLTKTSYLCLTVLRRMGHLVPQPKADRKKAALNFALLSLALFAGYMATKDGRFEDMLKVCDGAMKFYKVFMEIVDILSSFFK